VAIASAALAGAAVVTFVLGLLALGWLWFAVVAFAELTYALLHRRKIEAVLASADRSAAELDLLSRMLARVEGERFEAERLRRIQAALAAAGAPPSRRIARLRLLVQLVDARRNQIFAAIAAPLMWGTQLAAAIERWRRRSGAEVGRWIAAVGETEALLALASHAWERPDRPFPELIEDGPVLEADDLGHPLLPGATCVRNDVRFGDGRRLFVVSGSNMSGKSTWLRTIGVNAVLAQAGAPVRARRMRLSPLRVAASMRNQDSLQDGRSRFYAEIERLKAVVDLTGGEAPVLFLLDELLHGTNSHDRAIGGEAVVRELVERGSIGLVTTHDLTLASIADSLGERAANVHFEDRIEDGRIAFDYRLRPGIVTKSNALELMRSVGLRVTPPGEPP
jgi:DNA mismatch repair ATPase MutS